MYSDGIIVVNPYGTACIYQGSSVKEKYSVPADYYYYFSFQQYANSWLPSPPRTAIRTGVTCDFLFALRRPQDFTPYSHPEGEPCMYWYGGRYQVDFRTSAFFLFRPGVVSRALSRGASRSPACTHGSSLDLGRDPWRVL